jgi:diguanylate cyclase (GGDEF)-like protein
MKGKPENDEEMLSFLLESEPEAKPSILVWRILIVDDEPEVHQATLLALKGVEVEGRALLFIHAFSAAEARARLAEETELAIVLLDVVMETGDAGLQLVRYIREELGNQTVRIILRTGQPGYAPEIETIRSYDINDYRTKTELTRVRLFSSITVAIRSYWHMHQLEANRRGLELIVAAGAELSKLRGLQRLAEGIVTELCALLGILEDGLVCFGRSNQEAPIILAAAGRYAGWIGHPLDNIGDDQMRSEVERTLADHHHHFEPAACLYFCTVGERSLVAYVAVEHPLSELDRRLIEVFCTNIAVAFENTYLYQRISDLAFEDQLVSLPNRNGFLSRIEERSPGADTVALVDLDGFADINSILDQNFGDAVLISVASRLRSSFSAAVTIARIGGDVFGLLGSSTELTTERISEVFSTPFEVGEETLRLSGTTGLAEISEGSLKAMEVLKNAGVSLKQAKSFSRGKALCFDPNLAIAARARMQMLNQLRVAFSEERLFLVFQPFVDLTSGRGIGGEALLRWRTEEGEFIPPDRFIPLAEQSGLMVPIGDWVMRSALEFLKHLVEQGREHFRMAVNVSHVQFREPDFVENLLIMIDQAGVNANNVEIELTESVAIENIATITEKLAAVRDAGISIAIDDFGTGYSSLNVVRQLKVDCLKIDRSFVSGESGHEDNFEIAGIVLQLARILEIRTTAEGIETEAQRDRLWQMGCGVGQGYLFSRPLTREQFEEYLKEAPPMRLF